MSAENQLQEKNTFNNSIDFETVMNQAFLNYKKTALYIGPALLVFIFLFAIVFSVAAIGFFGVENINERSVEHFSKLLQTRPYNFYNAGFSVLISCFISPFIAGFYKMTDAAEKDTSFGLSRLFSCYNARYFGALFGATFIISLIVNGVSLFFEEMHSPFIGLSIVLLVNFLTFLVLPLIVLGNCTAIESIITSLKIVAKQPFVLLILVIIGLLATLLGLFGLCIGIFFTYPFYVSIVYCIYVSASSAENQ